MVDISMASFTFTNRMFPESKVHVAHMGPDRTSGQFIFYHENEAIHNDKSLADHDDEPPCWNALAGNAIVMMKASIDTVSE